MLCTSKSAVSRAAAARNGKPRRKSQGRREVEGVLIEVAGLVQKMAAARSFGFGKKIIS
jgi:hypothetical protein